MPGSHEGPGKAAGERGSAGPGSIPGRHRSVADWAEEHDWKCKLNCVDAKQTCERVLNLPLTRGGSNRWRIIASQPALAYLLVLAWVARYHTQCLWSVCTFLSTYRPTKFENFLLSKLKAAGETNVSCFVSNAFKVLNYLLEVLITDDSDQWHNSYKQAHTQVLRFGGAKYILGGKIFVLYI